MLTAEPTKPSAVSTVSPAWTPTPTRIGSGCGRRCSGCRDDREAAADRGAHRAEDDVEAVALGPDLGSRGRGDGGAHEDPVAFKEGCPGAVPVSLDVARVVAQVGEQEAAGHPGRVAAGRPRGPAVGAERGRSTGPGSAMRVPPPKRSGLGRHTPRARAVRHVVARVVTAWLAERAAAVAVADARVRVSSASTRLQKAARPPGRRPWAGTACTRPARPLHRSPPTPGIPAGYDRVRANLLRRPCHWCGAPATTAGLCRAVQQGWHARRPRAGLQALQLRARGASSPVCDRRPGLGRTGDQVAQIVALAAMFALIVRQGRHADGLAAAADGTSSAETRSRNQRRVAARNEQLGDPVVA